MSLRPYDSHMSSHRQVGILQTRLPIKGTISPVLLERAAWCDEAGEMHLSFGPISEEAGINAKFTLTVLEMCLMSGVDVAYDWIAYGSLPDRGSPLVTAKFSLTLCHYVTRVNT